MIKTEQEALDYLNSLIDNLEEQKKFVSKKEFMDLNFYQRNLVMMSNSIKHSDSFFNSFFKDKTEKEVKQWIEEEAKSW